MQSNIRFTNNLQGQYLNIETARILDDVRFLTTSVMILAETKPLGQEREKIVADVHYTHGRLTSPPSTNPSLSSDFFYQSCRTAAIIYSSAILTRNPLSLACTPQLLRQLWSSMWRVPLQRWKQLPGIFLWVLLVVNPYAKDKPEATYLKALTPATIMSIGLTNWDGVLVTLRRFLAVQKWLRGDARGIVLPYRGSAPSRLSENEIPVWEMSEDSVSTVLGEN